MFSKIFFFLVIVCAVNASVLTVNVVDDDPKDEVASNPKDCNPQACDQLCRRLKFRGGACIGANCYCNKFLSQQEDIVIDPVESASRRSCNSRACDNKCRRTGWYGGVCVKGQCKCDHFLNTEDSMNDLEESISIDDNFLNDNFFNTEDEVSEESAVSELSEDQTERGCYQRSCDQLCRRLKFPGGACVNGRCKCDNFFATEDAADEYSELDTRRRCRITKCNRTCTRLGYDSSTCVNRRCKCYNKTQTQAEFSETSLPVSELSEDPNERGCNQRSCDQLCRKLKFTGGACVNGRCKCDKFYGTEDAVDEYSELDTRRVCTITKCNRTCTRLGYDSATCVNRRCKCYNKTRADMSETSLPVSELSEDQNERRCNQRSCHQLCRRLKFPGGACVNGRCKCDNFFGTEVDAVDKFPELDTRRVCKLRECNRTCARRGYARARCVNGWCNCYNKIQREDASPLNEVISDENEESNEILRTNEEELTDALP